MHTKSIWNAFSEIADYPTLRGDISVDTAIIGGGITGLATALELAAKGQRVAVLEALKVGGGTTSQSTGNVYIPTSSGLDKLHSKYNNEVVEQVIKARKEALDHIAYYIAQYGIDCDFKRVPWYLYGTEVGKPRVEAQLKVFKEAGAAVDEINSTEIPVPNVMAIKMPEQAQYNPMRFVQGLAVQVAQVCQLYECTKVEKVTEEDDQYQLVTAGGTVTAKHVVHATHTPKGIKLWHTLLGPYREYGIACKVRNELAEGIFWGYYDSPDEKISTRTYTRDGETFLCVIGKSHKVGQKEDNTESIQELEAFARKHFDVEEVVYRWGGQHYRPADLLPYIGRDGKNSEVYIATGFATDGLVWGVLSASIISDLITGKENQWANLFDPNRINPGKSAQEFIKENINVAGELIKDYFDLLDDTTVADIHPGSGDVVEIKGKKVAAYKDEHGVTKYCSAVCPHMGCIVHFNQAEKTWDCPCHGSRFATDGTVLEGPAFDGLKKLDPK